MSFKCDFCGDGQPVGTKANWVRTKVRRFFSYPVQTYVFEKDDWRKRWPLAVVSSNYREEVVEEKKACSRCAKKHTIPEVVEAIFQN